MNPQKSVNISAEFVDALASSGIFKKLGEFKVFDDAKRHHTKHAIKSDPLLHDAAQGPSADPEHESRAEHIGTPHPSLPGVAAPVSPPSRLAVSPPTSSTTSSAASSSSSVMPDSCLPQHTRYAHAPASRTVNHTRLVPAIY
eukprot:TRINITY_DN2171_c0_g1_i2.p1 TRINITY_DN2171_c0_g1~~TRINITY_DN2171_c0_g1_i2.p1  ORF type:complete len:142 (+),score=28.66 TRINITY_DN2171_c0_g1_i2:104-529(+)